MYILPRIKPIYPLHQLNSKVFRIGAQLGITTEIEDDAGEYWKLATLLTGDHSIDEITHEMRNDYPYLTKEDIIEGIDLFNNEGVLEENLSGEEVAERYAPNVNYFSRFTNTDQNRFTIQKKINETKILLLGLGGGGSNIATLLAGLGPKKMRIVDYDKVEESNLGRQFLYKESDIGKKKVDAAEEALRGMNSQVVIEKVDKKISSKEDVIDLTEDIDIVVCAIDEPPFVIHRIVNEAVVEKNLTCVFGASQVSRGRVFTVIPGKTGCFDCLNLKYSKNDPQFLEQFIGFRNINFDPPSIAYGPGIFQTSAAIVDELIRVITGYSQPRSIGTQYEINYEEGTSFCHPSWERLEEECPTCGHGNQEDWDIFKYYTRKE